MSACGIHQSTEVRMYSYAVRERFNAGQLALLLNIRSFANALASPQTNCVELKFAQVLHVHCHKKTKCHCALGTTIDCGNKICVITFTVILI